MIHKLFYYLNNSSFFPFYIVTPSPYGIGTATTSIRIALLKSIEKKKLLLVFVPKLFTKILKFDICNEYLFEKLLHNKIYEKKYKISKKIIFFILSFLFFIRRSIALIFLSLFSIKFPENFFFLEIGLRDEEIQFKNQHNGLTPYSFSLINELRIDDLHNKLSNNILQKLKIDKDQEFVCLHVRDGEYKKDYDRRSQRNSNIENYYELINYLNKKNIIVFRMGLKVKKKIEIHNKNIIDLPFLNINHDYFNLYLIKNCKFFIGTQSGMQQLAFLFNKDCLMTNVHRIFEDPPLTLRSRTITKIPYFKDKKNIIDLKKYLDLPYSYHHEFFINNELEYMENSEEDLYLAAQEFFELINIKNDSSIVFAENQKKFNSLLLEKFKSDLKNDYSLINHTQKIKLLKMLLSSKGAFSHFFLKKYFN